MSGFVSGFGADHTIWGEITRLVTRLVSGSDCTTPADSTYREVLVVAIRSLLESAIERGLVGETGARELLEGLVGELKKSGSGNRVIPGIVWGG